MGKTRNGLKREDARMKYSVNIEVIYKELPFAERFAAAKRDGFQYVEISDGAAQAPEELKSL